MPNIIRQIATDDDFGTQTIRIIMNENERGAQGPQGEPGEAATIEAGNAYSVDPEQPAAVMNTGTSSNAVFDFYIPKGDRGPQGDTGPAGPQGPQGPEGPEGPQGPQGPQGAQGLKGDTGPQGVQGPQGAQGPQGIQGPQGVQGEQGPTGKDFSIYKTYSSIAEMQADAANVPEGDFVLIASTPEDPDNAKLYVRTSSSVPSEAFDYLTDMSGAQGMKGDTGPQGPQGPQGIQGPQGEPGPTYVAGDAITISGDVISANINPPDFFTATANTSGTGNPVTLNNSIGLPLDSVQLKGDTTQQTYSGKNLFSTGFIVSSQASILVPYGDNGFMMTKPASRTLNFDLPTALPAGTYTISGNVVANTATYSVYITRFASGTQIGNNGIGAGWTGNFKFTFTNSVPMTRLYFFINGNDADGASITFNNLQIEAGSTGSTATTFEPYVGGIPAPNPDYPQTVNTVTGRQVVTISDGDSQSQSYEVNLGKNLFDKDNANIIVGYIDNAHTAIISNANNRIIWIPCEPNTTYTIQKTRSPNTRDVACCSVLPDIGVQTTLLGTVDKSGTVTTNSTAKYLVIRLWSSAQDTVTLDEMLSSVQIEKGSTATTYAPYFTPIELCKIGTYQDYIYKSGDDWYVHKATGKVTLTGSETWSTPRNDSYSIAKTEISSLNLPSNTLNLFINTFTVVDNAGGLAIGKATVGGSYVNFDYDGTNSNLAGFKTWLASNNTIIYAPLVTPTDIQITDSSVVAQLEALLAANSYDPTTIFTASSEYLPAVLSVSTLRKSLAGVLEAIRRQ